MERNLMEEYRRVGTRQFMRAVLIIGLAGLTPSIFAQKLFKSATGVTSPDMSGVPDVLQGKTMLLPQDDAGLLVMSNTLSSNPAVFIPLHSEDSNFQQQGTVAVPLMPSTDTAAIATSSASGRMFNNGNDVVMTLGANSNYWAYSYWDPVKGTQGGPYKLNQDMQPNGNPIYTKVVMGNFRGNNLQAALMFVNSDFPSGYNLWQMNIVAALGPSPLDGIDPNGGGPIISAAELPSSTPLSRSIVVGDFNGDGIDEIAVLLQDGEHVRLYTVNPNSLTITPWQTIPLPAPLSHGTLVAGRFNNSPNVVLAAVGEQQGSKQIAVDYIDPTTKPSVTIVPTIFSVPNLNSNEMLTRVFAQAAPIYNTGLNSLEQLVLGLAYEYNSWHAVLIGTFGPGPDPDNPTTDFNFNLQQATGYNGCLYDMEVGNYNNQDSNGNVNPNLQIALFKSFHNDSQCSPPYTHGRLHVELRSVAVPDSVIKNPQKPLSGGPTDWLDDPSLPYSDLVPNTPDYNSILSTSFLIGDLQGRSERLGAPEHIVLTSHIQPDFVLGMPPMHVDWIEPFGGTGESCQTSSQSGAPGQLECILNLDVKPYAVSSDRSQAFSSTYSLTGTDTTDTKQKNTSSWGISAKITNSVTAKYSIPEETSGSLTVKTSVGNSYNSVHTHYDGQYNEKTSQLTTQTGFDDVVFYTAETQNIYNYPVLGELDRHGNQVYATYSVPSQVQKIWSAGSPLDWYQPVHEPGNVLSYPWSEAELETDYKPGSVSIQATSGCTMLGSFEGASTVNWKNQHTTETEAGWTDALSENVDVSASGSVGGTIFGAGASVKFSTDIDVGSSQAWGALNQSTTQSTSTQAVVLTAPQFGKEATSKFAYGFDNFVFGNPNHTPPYQDPTTILPDNLDLTTSGPLYVGFTADPVTPCGGGGQSFWPDAYSQPDVALNHPDRWDVSSSNEASFNFGLRPNSKDTCKAVPSAECPLISRSFYRMKGLFISTAAPASDTLGAGTVQTVPAGQPVYLTARIYNYSLIPTDQTSPGSAVHVRFYAQKRCLVNYRDGQALDLCPNGAFQIRGPGRDGDVVIPPIPAFNGASGQANWNLATVKFETTGFDNTELVFWVVTWIEDANGNVISETPAHGVKLKSFAGRQFKNITDIPVDLYSNNVGFYSANHPFYIAPANAADGSLKPETRGPLQSIDLKLASRNFRVDTVTHFTARFTADDSASFPGSTVLYYDGDPAKGGVLFDMKMIHPLLPGSSTEQLINFRARRCGPHTLYAVSELEGLSAKWGAISANVNINPVKEVQEMMTYVKDLRLQPFLERALLANLEFAEKRFEQGNVRSGLAALRVFTDLVRLIPLRNNQQFQNQADVLRGRAKLVQTCEASLNPQQPSAEMLTAGR